MASRLARGPDEDLERALRELGRSVPFPAERDLAGPVGARLRAEGPRGRAVVRMPVGLRPARTLRRAVVLAAALLVLAAGIAVAGRLGLPGVRVIFSKTPPTIAPTTTPSPAHGSPTPSAPGSALGLGERVTLPEARGSVSFPVRVPSLPGLGAPDAVYRSFDVPGGRVSLVYTPRPGFPASVDGVGLLVTQFRGRAERDLLVKVAGPGTRVQHVRVHGYPGLWISGAPHEFYYLGPGGGVEQDTVRLSAERAASGRRAGSSFGWRARRASRRRSGSPIRWADRRNGARPARCSTGIRQGDRRRRTMRRSMRRVGTIVAVACAAACATALPAFAKGEAIPVHVTASVTGPGSRGARRAPMGRRLRLPRVLRVERERAWTATRS